MFDKFHFVFRLDFFLLSIKFCVILFNGSRRYLRTDGQTVRYSEVNNDNLAASSLECATKQTNLGGPTHGRAAQKRRVIAVTSFLNAHKAVVRFVYELMHTFYCLLSLVPFLKSQIP